MIPCSQHAEICLKDFVASEERSGIMNRLMHAHTRVDDMELIASCDRRQTTMQIQHRLARTLVHARGPKQDTPKAVSRLPAPHERGNDQG